ncbi:unnamed protein product, partial [Effrenium voratum]
MAALAAGVRSVSPAPVFQQESVVAAVKNLFPAVSFRGVQFPTLVDVLNTETFLGFCVWAHGQGLPTDGPLGPSAFPPCGVSAVRASMAEQAGAAGKRNAVSPVVPFGLEPEEHFAAALAVQADGCPLDFPAKLDMDLLFAADQSVVHHAHLAEVRAAAIRALRELARRLQPITEYLAKLQVPAVRGVNPRNHLAAIYETLEEVLRTGVEDAQHILSRVKAGPDDDIIMEAGAEDEAAGYCSPAMSLQEVMRMNRPFRLIRRFVITQGSGKKRVIDDACQGQQSLRSHDANRLQFASALQPCLHLQCLASALLRHGHALGSWRDTVVSAGEDLPQAYRKIPMQPEHSWACLVTYFDPCVQEVRFRRYHGMLFGLPLAVSGFNRLPFFLQALCRRLLRCLVTMYYDDLTFQDWNSTARASQLLIEELARLIGFPFSEEKRQAPCAEGDFLGLIHDLRQASPEGAVRLWIRERLDNKIRDVILTARQASRLTGGQAAKLFGCLAFRSFRTAGADRQCNDHSAELSVDLEAAFVQVLQILDMKPRRL